MKKTLNFLAASLLLVLMSSQLCFAAEKQDIPENTSKRIEVEAGVLELSNVPAVATAHVEPRTMFVVKTEGGNLNVRSGPGTSYSVIGQFANGTPVDRPDVGPHTPAGWDYVSGDDCNTGKRITGYVAIQYLSRPE